MVLFHVLLFHLYFTVISPLPFLSEVSGMVKEEQLRDSFYIVSRIVVSIFSNKMQTINKAQNVYVVMSTTVVTFSHMLCVKIQCCK